MIKRNTLQRTLVLDMVLKLRSHPTADEVYAEINKIYPTISRATVYRNLQQLCESGAIVRRVIPDSPDRYDHITTQHYHIRCIRCGKVADVEMPYFEDIAHQVKDTHGFCLTSHSIVFEGICEDCQKKDKC